MMSQLIAYLSQPVPVIDWNGTTIVFRLVDCLLLQAVSDSFPSLSCSPSKKSFRGTVAGRTIEMNSRLWVDMSGNDLYRIKKSIDNHSMRTVCGTQIACEHFALE